MKLSPLTKTDESPCPLIFVQELKLDVVFCTAPLGLQVHLGILLHVVVKCLNHGLHIKLKILEILHPFTLLLKLLLLFHLLLLLIDQFLSRVIDVASSSELE